MNIKNNGGLLWVFIEDAKLTAYLWGCKVITVQIMWPALLCLLLSSKFGFASLRLRADLFKAECRGQFIKITLLEKTKRVKNGYNEHFCFAISYDHVQLVYL